MCTAAAGSPAPRDSRYSSPRQRPTEFSPRQGRQAAAWDKAKKISKPALEGDRGVQFSAAAPRRPKQTLVDTFPGGNNMDIGIIGSGQIGGTLTRRLTALGHRVSIANSRGPASLAELAAETGATAATVE